MIEVDCYNCDSSNSTHYDSENGYNIVKCDDCEILFLNPRPSPNEITNASRSGMHKGAELLKRTGKFNKHLKKTYISKLNDFNYSIFFSQKKKITWLDIGSGNGEFVETLNNFAGEFIDLTGLEPNVKKLEGARERGMNIQFFDMSTHQEKYDVISALNMYSHLPNPPVDLAKWCDMLNEGGEILIQTGDSANLSPKDHHKPYFLPDHLSFTSKELLVKLLESIGMEVLQVEMYRLGQYPIFSPLELLKQIGHFLLPWQTSSFKFFPKFPDCDMWIRARKISK